MVQVIQANPTFGTLLAQHLGQALGDLGQGFMQGRQKQAQRQGISTLLQQYGISPEQAQAIANSGAEAKDILAHGDKLNPLNPQKQAQNATQIVFNEMSDLLAKNAKGIGISPRTFVGLNREGVENRAYFDTLRARFEATLLPLVNKGALSKERFNYLLSNIPKASDSQRAIRGKLRALAKDLNLDESALDKVTFEGENKGESPRESTLGEASSGHLLIQAPDGNIFEVPRSEAKKAEAAGGKIIR